LPALELALESRLSESGDSPAHCELSWIPGGSIGFLIDLFRFFELTMMVVRGRSGWWHFAPLPPVELRLWQISFLFIFISRS